MIRNKKISLCLPCRNEGAHLKEIVKSVPSYVDEIIIISNNSTDNTVKIAKSIKGKVRVIEDNRTLDGIGYGFAHMSGIEAAKGDIIIGADADGTYPLDDIKKIVNQLLDNNLDFISCNRYPIQKGTKIPLKLKAGVWLLNLEARLLNRVKIKDILSGMWLFTREIRPELQLTMGDWNLSPQIKINAATSDKIKFEEYQIVQHKRLGKTKQKYLRTGIQHASWLLKNRLFFDKHISAKTGISKGQKKINLPNFRKQLFIIFFALIISYFIPIVGVIGFILISIILLSYWKSIYLIENIILSILLLFVSNIALYSFITIFQSHLSVRVAPFVLFLIITIPFLYLIGKKKLQSINYKIAHQGDIPAVLCTIATVFFLLIPIYHSSGAQIAQFMSYGEDNASHYALTEYIYNHGAFAYSQAKKTDGLISSLNIYPQGFHVNAAVFVGLIYPRKISDEGFIKVYSLFIALTYGIFVYYFIKLCIGFTKKKSRIFTLSILTALCLMCGLGLFILLLDRGFQPQIFGYVFLGALVFYLNKYHGDKQNYLKGAYLGILLTIGIASSWWLLLPVVAVLFIQYGYNLKFLKKFLNSILKTWPLILVAAFAIAYPVIVNILFSDKQNPINQPGGVNQISWSIFFYLAPIILIAVPLIYKKIRDYLFIYSALVTTAILALGIGWYQKITVGHYEYYFYKSIYTILIFYFAIFFISCLEIISFIYKKIKSARWIIPPIMIILTIVIAITTNLVYLKVYIHDWFPNPVQASDLDILFEPYVKNYKDIVYLGGCNTGRDYLDDRWSGAKLQSEGWIHSKLEVATLNNNPPKVSLYLSQLVSSKKILIVEFPQCIDKIPNLQNIVASPNVTILKSN